VLSLTIAKQNGKKAFKTVLIAILIIAAALLLISFLTSRETSVPVAAYSGKNRYITPTGKAMVSAHRSGGGIFPENTLLAFKSCVNSDTFNTDIFEFDLHLTSDNVLVLLHDDTLDRTSNAEEHFGETNVKPSTKTYKQLRELNMGESFKDNNGNQPYKGLRGNDIPSDLRIVRLEEVLDYLCANGNYSFIIEIKDSGELGKQATDELYRVLYEKKLLDRAIVGTFHGEVTKYIDESHPDMMRSAGIREAVSFYLTSLLGIKRNTEKLGFDALQIPPKAAVLNLSTTRFINYAHAHDIAVQYWTVNDEEQIRELNEKGADAIISDIPDVAYRIINGE
jgi:glycerophosphoryl diester phosphodiesterase